MSQHIQSAYGARPAAGCAGSGGSRSGDDCLDICSCFNCTLGCLANSICDAGMLAPASAPTNFARPAALSAVGHLLNAKPASDRLQIVAESTLAIAAHSCVSSQAVATGAQLTSHAETKMASCRISTEISDGN
jgi:hypothetical protein